MILLGEVLRLGDGLLGADLRALAMELTYSSCPFFLLLLAAESSLLYLSN